MTNDDDRDAATAATKTHGQTGSRTEAGKSKSYRNSIRTGLYAARDFIRPDEEEECAQSHLILRRSLAELKNLQKGRTIQEQIRDQFQLPNPSPPPTPPPPCGGNRQFVL